MFGWEKMDELKSAMGADALLDDLINALCDDELQDLADFIARNNDIELDDEEDD